jgi:hypothetical protein
MYPKHTQYLWKIGGECSALRNFFLPDSAKQFAADDFFPSLPIGHQPLGSGQYSNSHTIHDPGNLVMPHINAASRFADSFGAGNTAFPIFIILQLDPYDSLLVIPDQLEILDVAFFLKQPRDTRLYPGSRDVHFIKTSFLPVPYAVDEISNGIRYCHKSCSFSIPKWLPACFDHAGQFTFERHGPKTNAANTEFPDEGSWSTAKWTAVVCSHLKFWAAFRFCNQ